MPWAVSLTCVLTVWLVAPAAVAGARPAIALAPQATANTLTKCTFAALQKAVAAGGTVQFAYSGTIPFTQAITLSAGSVTLDVSGWPVLFDGQGKTRLFDVKGGALTLVDLTLQDGAVTGAKGASGAKGPKGSNGDNGADGTSGVNASSPGQAGTEGQPGQPGGDGEDGTNGSPATDGGDGQGGAIYVAAGAKLTVAGDTFKANAASGGAGGAGGKGGAGGIGGNGGSGGDGGNGGSATPGLGPLVLAVTAGTPATVARAAKAAAAGLPRKVAAEATGRAVPSTARARAWS